MVMGHQLASTPPLLSLCFIFRHNWVNFSAGGGGNFCHLEERGEVQSFQSKKCSFIVHNNCSDKNQMYRRTSAPNHHRLRNTRPKTKQRFSLSPLPRLLWKFCDPRHWWRHQSVPWLTQIHLHPLHRHRYCHNIPGRKQIILVKINQANWQKRIMRNKNNDM